jgi:hypothetical protein
MEVILASHKKAAGRDERDRANKLRCFTLLEFYGIK